MREAHDKSEVFAADFIGLAKALDWLKHDLLIAKLHLFDFNFKYLKIKNAYWSNKVQVTKVGYFYSEILEITFGVLEGSTLGPLLFSLNVIDVFWIIQCKSIQIF